VFYSLISDFLNLTSYLLTYTTDLLYKTTLNKKCYIFWYPQRRNASTPKGFVVFNKALLGFQIKLLNALAVFGWL